MSNRKRMGMFDHAKYSKPVLRSITEPVQRAVKRDINKLLDYGAASVRFRQPEKIDSEVSVVEDSFEQQQQLEEEEEAEREAEQQQQCRKKFCPEIIDLDKPPIVWASSLRPPEKSFGLGRDPSFAAVRDALLRAAPARGRESPKMGAEERLAMLLNPGPQNKQCTPIQRCSDVAVSARPQFPSKCPLDRLAARLMDSFPTITLKNNEPLTLTDATFSMAKRALLAAQERHSLGVNNTRGDSLASEAPIELNPLKSISDQTVCFFRASEDEAANYSDDQNGEISMDESPTADIYQIMPRSYGDYYDGISATAAGQSSVTQSSYSTQPYVSHNATPSQPFFDFFRNSVSTTAGLTMNEVHGSYDDFIPRVCDDGNQQPLFRFSGVSGDRSDTIGSPEFDF
ncbi:hypothetical protein niasHS_013089 [Heterodera schachtii]|uniref:Uncharacterized protein n=1 Tax=Heterodera schachtii TaxID=97005 RepID=A0ABD2IIM1_HETSC